ncbi:hypothetical protein CKJ81_00395 [Corynebacterium hadale]|uniref:Uncharacterized protein n=1 Tax=Corynebacterium hadale TaxID=2026255 RepID=A0ABX4HCN6_9CORY|nr:hypothetical protein [Corynebacterium hadale]PAT07089.1 hypothetical protein CKJ81_00395 [Corynebacterium hadale]
MDPSRKDLLRALWGALLFAVAVLLVIFLRLPGLMLTLLLIPLALAIHRRYDTNPEIASLKASLRIARDDMEEILQSYDDLKHGTSTQSVADRTLHYPALANGDVSQHSISEFLLRTSSARRFIARIDGYLESPDIDRFQLEKLIGIADERALELSEAWDDARRAARQIGPA